MAVRQVVLERVDSFCGRPGTRLMLVVTGFVVVLACSGPKLSTKSYPEAGGYQVRSVVVMPFATLATPQAVPLQTASPQALESSLHFDRSLVPPPGPKRLLRRTASVPPAAGMKVARIFSEALRGRAGIRVFSPAEAEVQLKQLVAAEQGKPEHAGARVAKRLKADAVLIGLLRVFRERDGSRYGAEPAAVGFGVTLIAADGQVLWTGDYYEAQRPLTEDVTGFLERGVGFLTADELATDAVQQLVRHFPYGAS